jgi:ABC-type amino acid transport substrate-binding protein
VPGGGSLAEVAFSTPFASWAEALFARRGNTWVRSADDLPDRRIGVEADTFAAEYFARQGYMVGIFPNAGEALLAVHGDTVDVALVDPADARAAIQADPRLP